MTWAQLDDQWDEHPKYAAADLGLEHFGLMACAITYSNRHLTDGSVPSRAVLRFANGNSRVALRAASKLVEVGIWEKVEDGYLIVGYLDHNPPRALILAKRIELSAKRAAAGKAGGEASGEARKPKQPPSNPEAKPKQPDEAKGNPSPSPSPSPLPLQQRDQEIPLPPSGSGKAPSATKRSKTPAVGKSCLAEGWRPSAESLRVLSVDDGVPEPVSLACVREFVEHWAEGEGKGEQKKNWETTFRNRVRWLRDNGRLPVPPVNRELPPPPPAPLDPDDLPCPMPPDLAKRFDAAMAKAGRGTGAPIDGPSEHADIFATPKAAP